MLSGETTVGKFPVEVVTYMANICKETESYYDYDCPFDSDREVTVTETIANGVFSASRVLDVKAIVVSTETGATARVISNLKPECPILAATPSEDVAHKLAACYGVYPIIVPNYTGTDEMVADVKERAIKALNLQKGDKIIITGGFPKCGEHMTNLMKIEEI